MAASNLSWTADDSKLTEVIELFLDSEPEVKIPATAKRHALDNTKKNCYTAVLDGKIELLLSSSSSVIHLQQFFFVLSRVASSATV